MPTITAQCIECGAPFSRKVSERVAASGTVKYCSRPCYRAGTRGVYTPAQRANLEKLNANRDGPNSPSWKGGEFVVNFPTGPRAMIWVSPELRQEWGIDGNKKPYIRRSHYVWNMNHPDDLVKPGEVVHHINGDTLDDQTENLEKHRGRGDHTRKHFKGQPRPAMKGIKWSRESNKRRSIAMRAYWDSVRGEAMRQQRREQAKRPRTQTENQWSAVSNNKRAVAARAYWDSPAGQAKRKALSRTMRGNQLAKRNT